MNIRDVLQQFTTDAVPRNELRLLLAHVLGRSQASLVAHDSDALSEQELATVHSMVARRSAGEPVAYLLGYRAFYGRNFKSTPAALIPRAETELLIDTALAAFAARKSDTASAHAIHGQPPYRLLDVGTGSGCIAITLALELAALGVAAQLTACDLSRDALTLARENAHALSASVHFVESHWFSAIDTDATYDVIVSNPPYIVPNDPHLSQGDLRFEPILALKDAVDGLQSYRELASGALRHLRAGGLLMVEHGYDQGDTVPALFREAGFSEVTMLRDYADQPRITCARR